MPIPSSSQIPSSIPFTFHYPTLGVKMVVRINPRSKFSMAKTYTAFYRQGFLLNRKWNVSKKWNSNVSFIYIYTPDISALCIKLKYISNIEHWYKDGCVYFQKVKRVHSKWRNPFITAHWSNIGVCKGTEAHCIEMN